VRFPATSTKVGPTPLANGSLAVCVTLIDEAIAPA